MARIAFVDSMAVEKLGVIYLSSALKECGHEVEIFLQPLEADFVERIAQFQADVVAFGSFIGQEPDVIDLFSAIKARIKDIKTVQGGPSTMIYSDLIYHPVVDFVLKGDGEETLPALLRSLDDRIPPPAIPGLLWQEEGQVIENPGAALITDFNCYPPADRDLHMKYDSLRSSRTKPFLMTRGCPFPCTFCGTATLNKIFKKEKGLHFRYGDGERTIAELEYVKQNYGLEWVQFHDATFNAHPKFAMKFLELYASRDLPPFICNVRSESVSEDLVRLFKEARCDRVTMGIQSGSQRIRRELSGRRTQTDENILYACKLFKKYGIRVNIDLIFGWPGETIAEGLETISFARKAQVDKVNNNVMIYYPDAPITRTAAEQGFLAKFPDVFEVARLSNPLHSRLLKTPDIQKLVNLDKLAHYFIRSRVLAWPPIRDILLGFKPNRFFYFLKNLPALRVSMKYDARSFKEKLNMIRGYIDAILQMDENLTTAAARAEQAGAAVQACKQAGNSGTDVQVVDALVTSRKVVDESLVSKLI